MTAVYIILGILLFFFLLSLLRIGVRADFAGDLADTSVTVIAGPARIQMLPKPDKPEKPKIPLFQCFQSLRIKYLFRCAFTGGIPALLCRTACQCHNQYNYRQRF